MNRPKCLLLLPRIPFPPVGGDKLRFYHLLPILSNHYNLKLVVITDEKIDRVAIEYIERFTKDYKLFSYSKWHCKLKVIKGLFSSLPLQVSYYNFKGPQKYIDEQLECCDFIFACLIRTTLYVSGSQKYKFHDMTDSIALNYERSVDKVSSFFWRMIYKVETDRLFKYEENVIRAFDNTFLVNDQETKFWANKGEVTYIPNGVGEKILDEFYTENKTDQYKNSLVFFGKMDYQPNIDAVQWFCKNVLPYLLPPLKFIILGARPTYTIKKLASQFKNVEVTGFLDNPYPVLKSCLAVVAPMRTGGGIQNKILESMALGKVVVTSPLGAGPIRGAMNMEHLVIVDDKDDWIKALSDIAGNPAKFYHIGDKAHSFIKEHYTWQNYEVQLVSKINQIVLNNLSNS